MSDKMDMRISGSSTMPGGEYGKVSISGSGKVQGNLKCESLSCSGAGKVKGDMVAQNVRLLPVYRPGRSPGVEVLRQLPGHGEGHWR